MRCTLHQQIGFDAARQVTHVPLSELSGSAQIGFDSARQVTHVPLSELSGSACRWQVKPPVDALPADATHDVLYGDVKSCLLPAGDARWL